MIPEMLFLCNMRQITPYTQSESHGARVCDPQGDEQGPFTQGDLRRRSMRILSIGVINSEKLPPILVHLSHSSVRQGLLFVATFFIRKISRAHKSFLLPLLSPSEVASLPASHAAALPAPHTASRASSASRHCCRSPFHSAYLLLYPTQATAALTAIDEMWDPCPNRSGPSGSRSRRRRCSIQDAVVLSRMEHQSMVSKHLLGCYSPTIARIDLLPAVANPTPLLSTIRCRVAQAQHGSFHPPPARSYQLKKMSHYLFGAGPGPRERTL